jgi:hypothetical protein
MLSIYHAGLHYQSLPSLLELSRGITAFGNITTCMHAGLSEVYLT